MNICPTLSYWRAQMCSLVWDRMDANLQGIILWLNLVNYYYDAVSDANSGI